MQAVNLPSETTVKAQPGTNLVQIRGNVFAGTVPEKCELDQLSKEINILTFLAPR